MVPFQPASGLLHQQTYDLPRHTPRPTFGSFHQAGSSHGQLKIYSGDQNSRALPRFKFQDTTSLPAAVENPIKFSLQTLRKRFSPGRPRKVPRRPLVRKRFMATDNGQPFIPRNANMNSKWNFLSGEYDLKKDHSLGSSGNKKSKRGRKEEF